VIREDTVLDIESALMKLEEIRDVRFVFGLFETCFSVGEMLHIPESRP
jgi:hypothetical protein